MSAPQLALFDRPPMLRDTRAPLEAAPAAALLGTITPRDYQRAQHEAVNRELEAHRSTLVVGATGTGKTILLAMQAAERGGALVLAQEGSPIEQAAQKLRHVVGLNAVAVEKAADRAWLGARYIVASVQSLRGARLATFARLHAGVRFIVIDEAHHALAQTYLDILAAFPDAKVLGITATPDRGDRKALGRVFDTVAHTYQLFDAVADGWLARLEWRPMDVSGVKLDRVGLKGGDLDQDQLDAQTVEQAAQIAQAIVQKCQGLRTIAFAPGVPTARAAAAALNEIEPGTAQCIHGGLSDDEKRALKAGHKRGDFPYLTACSMLIEAYDDERLRCVVDLAKTKSRARFAQKPGRVTRPWPLTVDGLATAAERRAAIAASPKPTALFFDANYGEHGHRLAVPTDLMLGGRYGDEVRARANKNLADQGGGDVGEALEQAAHEIEAEKARKVRRAAARAAKVQGDVTIGSPLTDEEMYGPSLDLETEARPFDLVGWLQRQGVPNASLLPVARQKEIRRKLVERKRLGLGSLKQVYWLMKLGVAKHEANQVTARRCGLIIGKLKGRRFTTADRWMLGTGDKV